MRELNFLPFRGEDDWGLAVVLAGILGEARRVLLLDLAVADGSGDIAVEYIGFLSRSMDAGAGHCR